jgi:hypothetical protein
MLGGFSAPLRALVGLLVRVRAPLVDDSEVGVSALNCIDAADGMRLMRCSKSGQRGLNDELELEEHRFSPKSSSSELSGLGLGAKTSQCGSSSSASEQS